MSTADTLSTLAGIFVVAFVGLVTVVAIVVAQWRHPERFTAAAAAAKWQDRS